jgi:hypothetical protein
LKLFIFSFVAIIPNQQIQVTIEWSEPKFYLWQAEDNDHSYRIDITAATLYVDCCSLGQPTIDLFERKYIDKKEAVVYHYNGKVIHCCLTQLFVTK